MKVEAELAAKEVAEKKRLRLLQPILEKERVAGRMRGALLKKPAGKRAMEDTSKMSRKKKICLSHDFPLDATAFSCDREIVVSIEDEEGKASLPAATAEEEAVWHAQHQQQLLVAARKSSINAAADVEKDLEMSDENSPASSPRRPFADVANVPRLAILVAAPPSDPEKKRKKKKERSILQKWRERQSKYFR